MKAKALIIHTASELREIFKIEPQLKETCDIYFLTADIDYNLISEAGITDYSFFDNGISVSELRNLHRKAIYLTDHWYIDESGNDFSMIEDFSIGKCFHQFLCHVFSLAFKYQSFLKFVNHGYSEIIISNTPNSLLEIFLKDNIFSIEKLRRIPIVDLSNPFIPTTVITFKTEGFKTFFTRNFSIKNLARKSFINLWMRLKNLNKVPRKIFFVPAGKSRDLIQHYACLKNERKINFIFPLTSESFSLNAKNLYHEISPSCFPHQEIKHDLLKRMREKLSQNSELPNSVVMSIVEEYLSVHFDGIFSYYKTCLQQLKISRPDLVMLSAESHETNIIMAQAAKNLKIKTCMIPHGITFPLLSEIYYTGTNATYNSAFLFSESNKASYLKKGFSEKNLHISSFYYFSNFLPVQKIPNVLKVQKALILPPDFSDFCRASYSIEGTKVILDTCVKLGITNIAIKARIEAQLKSMFIKNSKIIFNEIEIPIYSGYSSFPQYAKNSDIVIGPPSSATIESLMMGVPYFCYQEEEVFIGGWEYSNIESILHIAKTSEELLDNIKNYKIFQEGKTINDLIYLTNLEKEKDFIDLFEKSILNCLFEK